MKQTAILVALVALLLGLTAGCSKSSSSNPTPTPTPTATPTPTPTPIPTPTPTPTPPPTTAYTFNNVQIVAGGFVDGIVFHPTQPNLVYARTDIGGAYRWDTVTSTWIPLLDWIGRAQSNYIGVESIGLDPADPTRLYLAAGTYVESFAGNGAILVSTDQGHTFTTVPLPIPIGANDNGRHAGERLAVDPNLGSIVYFGSRNNGLWKSTDHGATWSQVSSFPVTGPTGGTGVGVVFVDFIKSSGSSGAATPLIYVGVSDPVTNLYRSADAGLTWQAVPGQPTGLYPSHGPVGPDGNIYISYGNDVGPNNITAGAVWRYTPPPDITPTFNGTWTRITPPTPSYTINGGYGYGCVAVDLENPGVIMVSTLDLWFQHDDIFRSLDGGDAWEEVGATGTWDAALSPWVGMLQSSTSPGWWMGSLAIDPFNSGHAMYGTGATIWSTSNAAGIDSGQPVNWTIGARGIEETAVLQLISPPSGPANLLSAVGDIGGFAHLSLTQTPPAGMMTNPILTTTTGLDFAQNAPLVIARTGYHNNNLSPFGAYSTDGGITWTPFAGTAPGATQGAGSIAVSADGATFVWAPLGAPVAVSTDHGATWTPSPTAPAGTTVVADRVNPRKFYIASSGSLYRSTDGGATFATTNATATGTPVASLAAEGDLWVASNSGLFHSTDSGGTFASIAGVQQAYSVGLGMAAPGATYPALYLVGAIGGVQGIFRSTDAGATWARINDDQHQYGNASMVIGDPRVFGRVYIGTNGRGVIYGDPASPAEAHGSSATRRGLASSLSDAASTPASHGGLPSRALEE